MGPRELPARVDARSIPVAPVSPDPMTDQEVRRDEGSAPRSPAPSASPARLWHFDRSAVCVKDA